MQVGKAVVFLPLRVEKLANKNVQGQHTCRIKHSFLSMRLCRGRFSAQCVAHLEANKKLYSGHKKINCVNEFHQWPIERCNSSHFIIRKQIILTCVKNAVRKKTNALNPIFRTLTDCSVLIGSAGMLWMTVSKSLASHVHTIKFRFLLEIQLN